MEEKKEIENKVKSGAGTVDRFSGYIAAFLIGAGVAGGLCWYFMGYSQRDINSIGKDFAVTKECREILEKNGGVSENEPVENAISAYVTAIAKDKYTYYYEEDEVRQIESYVNTSGTAEMSGFQVAAAEDGNILLTEVTDGLPAYKQGLRVNDEITAINGDSVSEAGLENIANKMLGKDGTEVTFTVLRDGQTFDVDFVRSSVMKSDVTYEALGDIAYIRVLDFSQLAQGNFNQALEKASDKKKIIFDLRDNVGGETDAAVYMAAMYCGHSKCVQNYYSGKERVIEEDFDVDASDIRTVVLVNEKTASAAEIFSASLKSNGNATLIGAKTRGKGVFQREETLSNGGILHYTAGTFTVDDWENWDGVGITPDVEVAMDREFIGTENDVQLKKAKEFLDRNAQ